MYSFARTTKIHKTLWYTEPKLDNTNLPQDMFPFSPSYAFAALTRLDHSSPPTVSGRGISPGSSLLSGGTLSLTSVRDSSEADKGTKRKTAAVSKQTSGGNYKLYHHIRMLSMQQIIQWTGHKLHLASEQDYFHKGVLGNVDTKLTLLGLILIRGGCMSAYGQCGCKQNVIRGRLVIRDGEASLSESTAQRLIRKGTLQCSSRRLEEESDRHQSKQFCRLKSHINGLEACMCVWVCVTHSIALWHLSWAVHDNQFLQVVFNCALVCPSWRTQVPQWRSESRLSKNVLWICIHLPGGTRKKHLELNCFRDLL